mmetsp:Transcript_13552/g.20662  ORF Transcript_13552/g.20662 Transcript_13552/m.20662 type:complete len:801 (-) Transcript_13552:228-2630(-)|eukprot:CAMPEP_0196805856 /NCGR_PEP_ID=MMETSP1362-20130617/5678_1 /TAXON_ID=163516 /ORGANISM="Leptocylindrus danicus, Strain CCMP1856" /LENGTH=800 /DNA_ID=CAMNT_0042179021 /DNA_START=17 /DNA_END=2419 /DNA_ORIENTATION=+
MSGEPRSRESLRSARRVLIKAGTSIVANDNGKPSLTRLGAIAEQIGELVNSGVEVIFVSSGAVGMGKRMLKNQTTMQMTFSDLQNISRNGSEHDMMAAVGEEESGRPNRSSLRHRSSGMKPARSQSFVNLVSQSKTSATDKKTYDSACAAAGQFEMMNLYSSLFQQCDVTPSQLLLTQVDFSDPSRLSNLKYTVERLLGLGIVPIINENDAVSGNLGYTANEKLAFSDNDGLAALCARSFDCEAVLLLTDVDGVYDRPPSEKGSKKLRVYHVSDEISIGNKSKQGRGGMGAKIDSAVAAVVPGSLVQACIIAPGNDLNVIRSIFGAKYMTSFGLPKGTLFATPGSELEKMALEEVYADIRAKEHSVLDEARKCATAARTEARKLQTLPYEERRAILYAVADALMQRQDELLLANAKDLIAAKDNDTAMPLVRRLKLTEEKIATLASGIRQIADQSDPLGVEKSKRELADGLVLTQITVPIGVLMIIFESRPDSLPQISALALASGNGLLLKGGKEAANSNEALHNVIGDAIESGSEGKIKRDIIALITSRGQVKDMLSLDDVIDLVIPRGGNALVSHIKANTRIPVLGHADGVCHVYVDATANAESACKIAVDAKTDYPSACNAMETLLLHKETLTNGVAMQVMMALRLAAVKCLGGPRAMKSGLCDVGATEMKCEYGDLTCMVEVVENLDEAVDWIHKYGSGHTECIVCDDDSPVGEEFLKKVDAACVFKNASTRFADGFRFGLGAEVGISTGRIHARGPVGVEGLLTTKWQLRSSDMDYVGQFGGDSPTKKYTHKELM